MERHRRSISTHSDWIWEISLLIEFESSGESNPPAAVELPSLSSRSTPSLVLNRTLFAFWYSSDSVPPPPAPSITVAIETDSLAPAIVNLCCVSRALGNLFPLLIRKRGFLPRSEVGKLQKQKIKVPKFSLNFHELFIRRCCVPRDAPNQTSPRHHGPTVE